MWNKIKKFFKNIKEWIEILKEYDSEFTEVGKVSLEPNEEKERS